MKQKINPIILFSLTALILGGILLPLGQAHAAGLGDLIGEAIKKIIVGAIDIYTIPLALVLMLVQVVTGILPFLAAEIMKIAIATNETIPLIPSGAQDMVSVGWQFTRDLANMFFILILAWVGFATILQLETYEVKKILPKLIIIALLINFIPVIAGVIIDISNIITHYFVERSSGAGEWLVGRLPMNDIIRGGWGNIVPGEGGIAGMAVKSLMGIIFNLVAFFMLTLYAALFILRIVAIWVLLVLAPLAWLGYIIPDGKKWWDMWWKQFLQWAMIGIPLTFFLFLSGLVLGQGMACEPQAIDFDKYGFGTGVLAGISGELLCSILPFTAGTAVMLIGFLLSITLAPMGADAVIKSAKKGGIAASKVAGTAAAKGAWRAAQAPREAFRSSRQAWNIHRGLGHSPRQALGAALERGWAATRLQTTGELRTGAMARSVSRGTWKAIKDSAKAGWAAGSGIKQKKKPKATKRCPGDPGARCGRAIDDALDVCPFCGHIF